MQSVQGGGCICRRGLTEICHHFFYGFDDIIRERASCNSVPGCIYSKKSLRCNQGDIKEILKADFKSSCNKACMGWK